MCSIKCEYEFLPLNSHVLMHINNIPKINFICLCNKEIYCIFQSCCMISVFIFHQILWIVINLSL